MAFFVLEAESSAAPVPGIIGHQGKLTVHGTNFTGSCQFKFALVTTNAAGLERTLWSHDGTSTAGEEPSGQAVLLPVIRGLFSVNLGDTSVTNMAVPIPSAVFTNDAVFLRIWVNDGINGSQQLSPDRRMNAVGYALVAERLANGAATLTDVASATNFSGSLAGEVTGSQGATIVASVSGIAAAVIASGASAANAATEANTPGTLVRRDASGNFSAGTVNGRFAGDGSMLTNLPASPGAMMASAQAQDPALIASGYRQIMTIPAPAWVNGSTANAPSSRSKHTAIFDGQRMIVWGGIVAGGTATASGGMYDVGTDSWTAISTINAPSARSGHSAVWTGTEMILWGGLSSSYLHSGARFNPTTQQWTPMPTNGAPSGRQGHVAVWTGGKMVIWGGQNFTGLLSDCALYDPVANQWTPLALPNAPEERTDATGVWAEDRLILWGGEGFYGELNTGGQLIFSNGTPALWLAMSTTNAPAPRSRHSAVWTGTSMLVWGGRSGGFPLGDGAAFCPCNEWQGISATNAPAPRYDFAAVWSGTEMLIFGGANASTELATASAYDPATPAWRTLSSLGGPVARSLPTAVWTGTEAIVFGGRAGGQPVAGLQRLSPQPAWYFYRKL